MPIIKTYTLNYVKDEVGGVDIIMTDIVLDDGSFAQPIQLRSIKLRDDMSIDCSTGSMVVFFVFVLACLFIAFGLPILLIQ